MSETHKYLTFTQKYCYRPDGLPGCGVDIASGGAPVVSWAWQLELPPGQYAHYNANHPPRGPIQLYGDAARICAESGSLDFVYASHILEDYPLGQWSEILMTWKMMLKPGGNLIILVPERVRWAEALRRGQSPNCSHRYEPALGDMSRVAKQIGLEVVEERMTNLDNNDYTILGVFKKP